MDSSKMSIVFLLICLLALLEFSHAQNSQQDYLNTHNTPRNQVKVGNIIWNNTVAAYALNYANQRKADCSLVHSNGPYGENLAKGTGTFSGTDAVNLWVQEKSHYVYYSNSCVGGECLHYTQVVWRDSLQVGCARVLCTNSWWYVVCSYYPPGNYEGEYPY
ncbi:Cysteine-rich secretory protein, allergen V5/Tpx-1-related [Trema orientale]|uniref:Cysteine-rich secretory protein, allergen V5/Tpx-1-related n=1 Tax=Trema orientale TaxID=63057 RepID=A0A2P5EMS2_TREOI|nr:Cysteine-rich secretory protein, allergen V5/Tpx-1-related [Trema orientale]